MSILPQTETFRQALEHLQSHTDEPPADVVAAVLDGTSPALSVVHQTVAFIVTQLSFLAPQDEEAIDRLLSSEVATPFGATQTLSEEWRSALCSAWLANGKGLVQAAREKAVERYCHGGRNVEGPRFLTVEAAVVTSSGKVIEAVGDDASVSVEYSLEGNQHVPTATVLFPPTLSHKERTPVTLDSDSMYKLFLELDNVQKAVDAVKGAA